MDGIVLHQMLQWHHMLSTVLPPTGMEAMRTNMLWTGSSTPLRSGTRLDLGFLASGAALMLLGGLLVRRSGSGRGGAAP